jgi:WD40 repeat protein
MKQLLGVGVSLVLGLSLSFLMSRAMTRSTFLSTTEEQELCERPFIPSQPASCLIWSEPSAGAPRPEQSPPEPIKALNRIVRGGILAVSYSPDGKYLASAGYASGRLTGLHLRDIAKKSSRQLYEGDVFSAQFSSDGKTIAFAVSTRLLIYDMKSGDVLELGTQPSFILGLAISPNGKNIATASLNGHLYLWDVAKKTFQSVGRTKNGDIDVVAFSPDGRTIATGGDDGPPTIWDVSTGTSYQTTGPAGTEVFGLEFSPNGRWLVWTASNSKAAPCIWDMKKAENRCLFNQYTQEKPYAVSFAPDGNSFLVAWSLGGARLYQTEGKPGEDKKLITEQPLYSIDIAPNGKTFATGGQNGAVHFWDIKTGKQQAHRLTQACCLTQ